MFPHICLHFFVNTFLFTFVCFPLYIYICLFTLFFLHLFVYVCLFTIVFLHFFVYLIISCTPRSIQPFHTVSSEYRTSSILITVFMTSSSSSSSSSSSLSSSSSSSASSSWDYNRLLFYIFNEIWNGFNHSFFRGLFKKLQIQHQVANILRLEN